MCIPEVVVALRMETRNRVATIPAVMRPILRLVDIVRTEEGRGQVTLVRGKIVGTHTARIVIVVNQRA